MVDKEPLEKIVQSQYETKLKKVLIGGAVAGLAIVEAGLLSESEYLEGFGYGVLFADILDSLVYAGYKLYNKMNRWKNVK